MAGLDDAGLSVHHKNAIAKAKKLRKQLATEPDATPKKHSRGEIMYRVRINGKLRWVSIPEGE